MNPVLVEKKVLEKAEMEGDNNDKVHNIKIKDYTFNNDLE